ncbi:MAG: hypothetical protein ACK5IJ_03565 [Mangrovibacterium sp.]
MSALLTILLLILIGIILLFIEFVITPGLSISGIGGILLLILSIFIAFQHFNWIIGSVTALFILIFVPILVLKFFKTRAGKKIMLNTKIDSSINHIENIQVHDQGITMSRLAPVGKSKIGNQTVETKASQGWIDSNQKIKVIEVNKNQIIVEPLN